MFESLRRLAVTGRDRLRYLPLEEIVPNSRQPRRQFDPEEQYSLTESVRAHGVLQPIAVRKRASPPSVVVNNAKVTAPAYEIIAGERRFRAASAAGLCVIPCVILDADDRESAVLALIENTQRRELNIFEEAEALMELLNVSGMTQTELARTVSMSQASLSNKLRLLRLDGDERQMILDGGLGERHARAFIRVGDPVARQRLIRQACERGLSAGETEKLVDNCLRGEKAPPPPVRKPRRIGLIRDIRFFYNTIDRAIETLRESGITSECTKSEQDGVTELIIRISSARSPAKRTP